MKKLLSLPLLLILTLGCSSTNATLDKTTTVQIRYSAFLGKTIPLFILSNGIPYSKKNVANGNKLYAWNSESIGYPYHYRDGNGFGVANPRRSQCEISMLVNPKGRIVSITAMNNFRKNWHADRCRDFLK